jgi:mono/diheme cytochrome c family protein
MRNAIVNAATCALGALVAGSFFVFPAAGQDKIKRGEYLATIMDCAGCHTPGALRGQPDIARNLAGSDVGFELPGLGVFYPPNLTSDAETGLGKWSEKDIVTAVRTGARPDGRVLAPIMPYHNYAKLTDADAQALAGYLKNLRPVANKTPAIRAPGEKATDPYLTLVLPK